MKISMTGQEKGDLLMQVTTWTGLTVLIEGVGDMCFIVDNVLLFFLRLWYFSFSL
jgi:hypothetical protein